MLKAIELILSSPQMMAYYNNNIFLKATLLALYNYKKQGLDLRELGWFTSELPEAISLKDGISCPEKLSE